MTPPRARPPPAVPVRGSFASCRSPCRGPPGRLRPAGGGGSPAKRGWGAAGRGRAGATLRADRRIPGPARILEALVALAHDGEGLVPIECGNTERAGHETVA